MAGGSVGGPIQLVGPSWASELKAYEHERRHDVNPELLRRPPRCLDKGIIARAEREYDTLLQRYRDDSRESKLRGFEAKERAAHLNRAMDVQIRRENKFNIVTHEGRLDAIAPPDRGPPAPDYGTMTACRTGANGYNLLSNLPTDVHHFAHPDLRPKPRPEAQRKHLVPARNVKDFNIVTNRYVEDHEAKIERDRELNRLEATGKYRQRNSFDPVLQRCTSPHRDERMRAGLDARETEAVLRAQAQLPVSTRGRVTEAHDLISNEVKDPVLLDMHLNAEQARTSRYRTRHLADMAIRERDIMMEDVAIVQKNSQISHERHDETARRGYDILTNCAYGNGPKDQKKHMPFTTPRMTTWEKALDQPPPEQLPTPRPLPRGEGLAPGPEVAAASGSLSARQPPSRSSRQHSSVAAPSGSLSARRPPSGSSRQHSAAPSSARGTAPSLRGSAALGSTVPPSQAAAMAAATAAVAPPAPTIPGTSEGSVYARPRG